jgi:hypothetical protein
MSPAYLVDAGADHSTLYIDRFHSKAHDDRGQPSRSAKTAEEGVLAYPLINVERLGIVALAETDDLSCPGNFEAKCLGAQFASALMLTHDIIACKEGGSLF